jgi:hypothetical protein
MGTLTPGATYIYERNGDTVYAREFGADPSTRKEIGWDYDPNRWDHLERQELFLERLSTLRNDQLWHKIRLAARDNVTLQDALDRVVEIYHLSKDNGQT